MTRFRLRRVRAILGLGRPALLLAIVCGLFLLQVVPVARSLQRSQLAQRELDGQIDLVVGAEAARRAAAATPLHGPPTAGATLLDIAGREVVAERRHVSSGPVMEVRIDAGEPVRFPLLDGRMPRALGHALSLLDDGGARAAEERVAAGVALPWGQRIQMLGDLDWPRLEPDVRALVASGGNRGEGLRRDDDIALLRLAKGTDLLDYVPDVDAHDGVWRPRGIRGGVLCVDGNFWIDHGPEPLLVDVPGPVTIVVRGNLYVGRSIRSTGAGSLLWIVQRGSRAGFRDLDADGARSPGDIELVQAADRTVRWRAIEGAGAVWLGLPGGFQPATRLRLDGHLLVTGELHLRAAEIVVAGALMLEEGMTDLPGHRRLQLGSPGLPDLRSARFPGVAPRGTPVVAPAPPRGG